MLSADAVPQTDHLQQEGVAFRCASNVCRPTDARVLQLFRQLQDQLNRASAALGLGTFVDVDGDIGPKTAQLVKTVAAKMRQYVPTSVVPLVGDGEMRQALDLNLPNIVAKFADPLVVYFAACETSSRALTPGAGERVAEYLKTRTALSTSTQTGPAPAAPSSPAGKPRTGSRVPWVIAGIGAALTVGITATAIVIGRSRTRRRRARA